ncbi:PREDICTED: PHD finger protein 7-like [Lepidothrix coronata]|uniref:PHD finger protein 7-like n=1 Tax=Lepidothrix coronata TaxID=321398 RepID=A0A6J0HBP7_9PASS|nr:PREDICTED: PHD finger protein 7-like [Lepidothrix coronata]
MLMCTILTMMQQDLDSREQVCMLCCQAEVDPNICGCKKVRKGLCFHTYCVFLASETFLDETLNGFCISDIKYAILEASKKVRLELARPGGLVQESLLGASLGAQE